MKQFRSGVFLPAAVPAVILLASVSSAGTNAQLKINRTVPTVTAPLSFPQFSASPSDAEIFRARVFEEPLVPIGQTDAAENGALARQLLRYLESGGGEDLAPFEEFLAAHPGSPWRASLLANSGSVYRRTGYIWRALGAWEEAWNLSKGATDPLGRAVADRALGEYAGLLARLGRESTLEALFAEIDGRQVGGSAAEKVAIAKDGLAEMRINPETSFRCGPLALDRVLASLRAKYASPKAVKDFPSTSSGTSLRQVAKLANDVGQPMRMVKRSDGSAVPLPAIIHWKSGHFAALIREKNGLYFVEDATFGDRIWISRAALNEEASGYAIVAGGPLQAGWRAVGQAEGGQVWGKGVTTANNPQNFKPCDPKMLCQKCTCGAQAMARYDIHLMLVSLNITDEPVGYSPPLGPAVRFLATYNQREVYQPQIFSYTNLGPKWTFDWLSYIEDNPSILPQNQNVNLYVRGGGQETYQGYNETTQTYAVHKESRASVKWISTTRYERYLADGSIEVFEQPDGNLSAGRKVFMTESIDPQGNKITLAYGGGTQGVRLAAITDAAGQVTSLSYQLPGDDLKITKITDPFGRFATFEYAGGRLSKITDVIGLESTFGYDPVGSGDFIDLLTTPYGTTSFTRGESVDVPAGGGTIRSRWLETTDALGGKERVAYYSNPGEPHNLPWSHDPPVPGDFTNAFLSYRNTLYWDKRAMSTPGPLDYSKARIFHWLHDNPTDKRNSGILESTKAPLERRVWYGYPQQLQTTHEGTHAQPSKIQRVLDDDTIQDYRYLYNMSGKVCQSTDPKGRTTRYTYGTATVPDQFCSGLSAGFGIDLLKVEQYTGSLWEVVRTATYNGQHQPLTVTDAAGKTTTNTYLADGRLQTVVTPSRNGHDGNALTLPERTTTYEYYSDTDLVSPLRLKIIMGPHVGLTPGPATTMTYDTEGRLTTTTDSDGYTLTMEYDALDRLTKTTNPDGTYEETTYNRLDAEGHRDRLGRWSYAYHDALRRVWQTKDALLRTTTMDWCSCGSLDGVTDPEGNVTTWDRDVQGRVTKETRADGKFWEYTYELSTSRLKSVTDPKLQVKTYTYDSDDKVIGIAYTNSVIPTPNVTYSYVPDIYGRLRTMVDGTGTTTYTYHPAGTAGALSVASVDGPGGGSGNLLEYTYDEMGRIKNRKLDGAAHEVSYRFDSLGRLRTQITPPGNFTYAYDGVTSRPLNLEYPNGQSVAYAYHPNLGDHRLQEIHNKLPGGGATLSKFAYTYYAPGSVETWSQQRGGSAAATYEFTYDLADQLRGGTPTGSGIPSYEYTYDEAGNRLTDAVDALIGTASYDNRNAIVSRGLQEGPLVYVPQDDYSQDANGNTTSDAVQTYDWDAENRLVAVKVRDTNIASFAYDGNGRRFSKMVGGVTRNYLYDGAQIVEERRPYTGGVIKYFDGPGIDQHLGTQDLSGAVAYFSSDHLGSITDVTNAAGAVTLSRKYDPWGSPLSGATVSGYAYTGREWDAETGLYYYRARYYDPKIGRFISEDPIGFDGGINFYPYVENNPVNFTDPDGLRLRPPLPRPLPRPRPRPRLTPPSGGQGNPFPPPGQRRPPSNSPQQTTIGPGSPTGGPPPGGLGGSCPIPPENPRCERLYKNWVENCHFMEPPGDALDLCLFKADVNYRLCLEGLPPIQ